MEPTIETNRFKFYQYLYTINDMLNSSTFDIKEFEDTIKTFIILTKLAKNEIALDDTINKDLETANYGLDCWDIIFMNISNYALKYITLDDFTQMVNTIDSMKVI